MPIEDRVREVVDAYVARVRHETDAQARSLTADILAAAAEPPRQAPAESVRRLDEATSLSHIFDVLLDVASAEARRVAILLVDGGQLRLWGQRGFPEGLAPHGLPIPTPGARGLVVPLVVGGNVVAVLYADDGDADVVALLAAHASTCLERVTSARLVGLA